MGRGFGWAGWAPSSSSTGERGGSVHGIAPPHDGGSLGGRDKSGESWQRKEGTGSVSLAILYSNQLAHRDPPWPYAHRYPASIHPPTAPGCSSPPNPPPAPTTPLRTPCAPGLAGEPGRGTPTWVLTPWQIPGRAHPREPAAASPAKRRRRRRKGPCLRQGKMGAWAARLPGARGGAGLSNWPSAAKKMPRGRCFAHGLAGSGPERGPWCGRVLQRGPAAGKARDLSGERRRRGVGGLG